MITMLSVFSIWMPGFTRVIAAKLFQTSPAQTSSTMVSAICAMTSAPRSRTDCKPAEPLLPSRNESIASTRVACHAGKQAENNSGDQCGHAGHRQDRHVQPDLVTARNPAVRETRQEQIQSPTADQHAADSAERDEQQRFNQMTARDGRATRAQSEPDRDFALPGGSADELEPGHVRARDQQHEHRSADDQEQSFTIIAHYLVAQRNHREVPALVKFLVGLDEPGRDRGKLRLHRRGRDARL